MYKHVTPQTKLCPKHMLTSILVVLYLYSPFAPAYELGDYSPEQALVFSQKVIGNNISDFQLVNTDNKTISLHGYQGKPLIVSFIYTSCYHFCPMFTKNLDHVVAIANEALGPHSFNVVSIGFDVPNDTVERMRNFAKEQGIKHTNWEFLRADENTIQDLTTEFGFLFAPTPKGFDHLAQTTVLDAQGRIYRQVYGQNYEPPHLVEPLKELIYGQTSRSPVNIADWMNNIRLFCTVFDPATGRYQFDYSIFVALLIGLLCLGLTLVFLIHAWHMNKRSKHAN